jgi:chemotaxis protein MotB
VGLHTYDDQQRRIQALEAAYEGADTTVGRYKQALDARDQRIRDLEGRIQKLGGVVQAANANVKAAGEAIERERSRLQEQYRSVLEELRTAGGGDFVINEQTGGLVLENDIFFAPGRADLKQEALALLDGLIEKLGGPELGQAEIEVAGHTDADPILRSGWKDNYQLSAERARAVLVYFTEKGIGTERIFLSGYGLTRPRSSEKSDNRRVEIVLHEMGE